MRSGAQGRQAAPVIVFSHANGFPARSYRTLMAHWLAAGYEVRAVEKYGHDPRYPVTDGWHFLRQQLIDTIEPAAQHGPVWLVGHSLGGYLSLLAASRRPELVAGVVLLDSPVLTGWRAQVVRLGKATGLIGRISPARMSHRRRHEWANRDEAHRHYAARGIFSRFDPRCLADYLHGGLQTRGTGVELAFARETESHIYNTLPHTMGRALRRRPLRCPVAYVAGTQSQEGRQVGLEPTRALVGERLRWMEGSHLFPFEKPDATAQLVLALLQELKAAQAPTAPG